MSALLAVVNRYAARRKRGPRRERANDVTDRLHGTWKLVSAVREEIPSGATTRSVRGEAARRALNYSPEGRIIALIAHGDRRSGRERACNTGRGGGFVPQHAEYGGPITRLAGDVVTHRVDISWNEAFTGGEQKRHFTLDGNRLTLSTPQSPDPIHGRMSVRRMTWEKV